MGEHNEATRRLGGIGLATMGTCPHAAFAAIEIAEYATPCSIKTNQS